MDSKLLTWGGYSAAIAIRVGLACLGATDVVQHRVEVVTPLNSFKRLAEGRWLVDNGFSPYQGWAYHASPMFLYLLQPFLGSLDHVHTKRTTVSHIFPCIAADVLSAVLLGRLVSKTLLTDKKIRLTAQHIKGASAKRIGLDKKEARSSAEEKDGLQEVKAFGRPQREDLREGDLQALIGRTPEGGLAEAAGILFLLNPYTVLSCIAGTTSPIENLLVLLALHGSVEGNIALATFGLVLATHLSLHPVLLAIPSLLLLHEGLDRRRSLQMRTAQPWSKLQSSETLLISPSSKPAPSKEESLVKKYDSPPAHSAVRGLRYSGLSSPSLISLASSFCLWLIVWTAVLLAFCKVALGKQGFLLQMWRATHGFILAADDLTPNVGLFWYFFAEVFDHFRTFFLFVFHYLVLVVLLPPLTIRFHRRPLFLAYVILGLTSIFKSYPSVSDAALYLGLLPAFARELRGMRFVFVGVNALMVATVIGPIMYNLWIWKNVGNANFFYAMTLVYACAQALIVVQSVSAVLRHDKALNSKSEASS